jgi:hypothetical protein
MLHHFHLQSALKEQLLMAMHLQQTKSQLLEATAAPSRHTLDELAELVSTIAARRSTLVCCVTTGHGSVS